MIGKWMWGVFRRLLFVVYLLTLVWVVIDAIIWLLTGKGNYTLDIMYEWSGK